MLSSVLRSPIAVRVNIEIMRAFVRLRRLLATPGELVAQLQKLAETVQLHDTQIKVITDVLQKMLEPPPADTETPIRVSLAEPSTDPPTGGRIMNLFDNPLALNMTRRHSSAATRLLARRHRARGAPVR